MFAVDPLLNDVDFNSVWITVLKVVVAFAGLLVSVIAMIWFERKLHADFSNRLGPRVAGPFGTLQTIADGMKLLFKADLLPDQADKFVYKLAPYLSMVPAFLTFVTIPIAGNFTDGGTGTVKIAGHDTLLQVADPQIGILFVLAMSSIAVYGIMLAGWSSGSKYPLLGSVRASAQMVSYEAALGLSLLCVLLNSGSLSTNAIVQSQSNWNWNLWATGIVPFVVFLIAGTAETNRPPFDLPEAESELVAGFMVEYASTPYLLYMLGEYVAITTMCAGSLTSTTCNPSDSVTTYASLPTTCTRRGRSRGPATRTARAATRVPRRRAPSTTTAGSTRSPWRTPPRSPPRSRSASSWRGSRTDKMLN